MEVKDTDWETAHLRVEENGVVEKDTDWETAHLRVEMVWRRKTPTGKQRT